MPTPNRKFMPMKSRYCHRLVLLLAVWLAILTLDFGHSATPSEKIQHAIAVSRELAALAEVPAFYENTPSDAAGLENASPKGRKELSGKIFPRSSHVQRYNLARPWILKYARGPFRVPVENSVAEWPTQADAASLRDLLKDTDPALRGMAAEALATLYQPEDAPALASLLDDSANSVPILWRRKIFDLDLTIRTFDADPLDERQIWQQRTVANDARDGLKLLTGREFADEVAFHRWWQNNSDARHCLWYWQQRLQREMDEVEDDPTIT